MIVFGAAATLYFLADGLVATLFPVQLLTIPSAVWGLADPASRRPMVEGGSALSAVREKHIELCRSARLSSGMKTQLAVR